MPSLDWIAALNAVRENIPPAQFQNWLGPIEFLRSVDNTVVLGVPNRFHEDWVKNHYAEELKSAIQRQTGLETQLEFEVLASPEVVRTSQVVLSNHRPALRVIDGAKESEGFDEVGAPQYSEKIPFSPNYPPVQNPFIEAPFNRTAYQCTKLFAEGSDRQLTTLVIWSNVGMGKTHLLSEIGQRVHTKDAFCRVRYTNSEAFTNEMVMSFKNNSVRDFKQKYQEETDILLFDDLQALSGRMKTQEQLLHTFNEITARGGRVAFSSSVAPQRLTGFIDPLKSRLLSGVIAEVRSPSFEERVQILGQVAYQNQMVVDPEAVRTLADKGQKDIRELIGSFIRIHLTARLENKVLDNNYLAGEGLFAQTAPQSISLDEIIALVEHNYGITRDELLAKGRKANVAWARQVAMYLARRFTELSLEKIGQSFGRDHATACYAFDKVVQSMKEQATRKYEVEFLVGKLESRRAPKTQH